MRFELMTSSLPRKRSTPELHWLLLERKTRFEPATLSLEGWCSTNWATSAYILLWAGHLLRCSSSFAPHVPEYAASLFRPAPWICPTQSKIHALMDIFCALSLCNSMLPAYWWGEKDSNLRRRAPADLQSAPVGHFGISPYSCHSMNLSR